MAPTWQPEKPISTKRATKSGDTTTTAEMTGGVGCATAAFRILNQEAHVVDVMPVHLNVRQT